MLNRYSHRVVSVGLLLLSLAIRVAAVEKQESSPPSPRVPWTSSHVVGSPEPLPPFQLERIYPKLTFSHPLDMGFAPGSDRRFVAIQSGKIFSFPNQPDIEKLDLFFDGAAIKTLDRTPKAIGVDAVFGFTFHPKFVENREVFICYLLKMEQGADKGKALRVSKFRVKGGSGAEPPQCDMASESILLEYFGAGHCAGCLKFGPDGFLYISTGDGGDPTPPDPFNTGQDISDLNSSILRIDVDHTDAGKTYAVPRDNPFITTAGARPEIWAYGLRNPWRFSFDRATGVLWAGDVGWETWEMVYRIERGANYGWSIMEGPGSVHPDGKRGPTPILPPTLYMSHAEGASITGGYVYHGKRLPELVGQYVFGDWDSRRLFAAPLVEKGLGKHRLIATSDQRVVSFAEDVEGELYVVDYEAGGLYRLVPQPPQGTTAPFPRKLSDTGLFAATDRGTPAPGVVAFTINAPQWVDGATAERWVAIPNDNLIKFKDGKPKFPANSVLTRTYSAPAQPGRSAIESQRIETQMLYFDGTRWNGYSYRWNDQQTDAMLVDAAGEDTTLHIRDLASPGGMREQAWHFSSRAQCMTCHNAWADYTLAFNPAQLGTLSPEHPVSQLLGKNDKSPTKLLAKPFDESAALDVRARSYLHANCAHCHRFGGGGSANIQLNFDADNTATRTIDVLPTQGTFGIDDARIIAPGSPSHSVLYYRMAKLGSGHMPHTGSTEIDPEGLNLIAKWIDQMPPAAGATTVKVADADITALRSPNLPDAKLNEIVDRQLTTTRGAMDLMRAIDNNQFDAAVAKKIAARGYASDRDEIRGLFARFIAPQDRIKTLGTSFPSQRVLELSGDSKRGRQVFFELSGGLCQRCHQVGTDGASFGPELTHIGSKYDRLQLLENILEPSKTIAPGFNTFRVKLKSGDPQIGLIVSRTDAEIVLKTAPGVQTQIPAANVQSVKPEPNSIMPDGLLGGLTAQQAADLLEYLQSLK